MARILIAYATQEGQTARIVSALARQLESAGHSVQVTDLRERRDEPDPRAFDGILLAASVHAGRHAHRAKRFVKRHRAALEARCTAFVSVSMSAAATTPAGLEQAQTQLQDFLDATAWSPTLCETMAGALRYSQLSLAKRLVIRVLGRLFRRELNRLGWPPDLTRDQEFTDWDAVRRCGERFLEKLGPVDLAGREAAAPVSMSATVTAGLSGRLHGTHPL